MTAAGRSRLPVINPGERADGRINWHFFVTDWNIVRLQLLGEAPDLPTTPERRAVLAG